MWSPRTPAIQAGSTHRGQEGEATCDPLRLPVKACAVHEHFSRETACGCHRILRGLGAEEEGKKGFRKAVWGSSILLRQAEEEESTRETRKQ